MPKHKQYHHINTGEVRRSKDRFFFYQGEIAFTSFCVLEWHAEHVSQVLQGNHKPRRRCVTHPSLPSSCYLCLCPYTYEIHGCRTQMLSLFSCFGALPRNRGTRPHRRLSFQRHPNIPIQYRLLSYFFYTALLPPAPFHTHIYKHSHTDKSGLSLLALALALALLIRPHCVNSTVPVWWPSPPLSTTIFMCQVCHRRCKGFKQRIKKKPAGTGLTH